MENVLYLSLFFIVVLLFIIILYLLNSINRTKKDIEIIKDELDITSAIFEVKFDKYGKKYKKKGPNLRKVKDLDEKKQLSLDAFLNF